MDYLKIYDRLILRAKNRTCQGYTELHHVVPRCMGGADKSSNLVRLTPEEHYVAHQLLTKIYPDNASLGRAAGMMCMGRTTNRLYGWIRRRLAEASRKTMTGHKFGPMSESQKRKISQSMKGKNTSPKSEAHKAAIGAAQLGKKRGSYKKRKSSLHPSHNGIAPLS